MSSVRSYPSVSHVFALAPRTAAAAFDVMILDPALTTHLIPAGPLVRAQPSGYDSLRRLPATLRLPGRRGRTLDVVLELLPWSEHRSELAIGTGERPHLFVERNVESYVRTAQRALSTLAELVDAALVVDPRWAADPRAAGVPHDHAQPSSARRGMILPIPST